MNCLGRGCGLLALHNCAGHNDLERNANKMSSSDSSMCTIFTNNGKGCKTVNYPAPESRMTFDKFVRKHLDAIPDGNNVVIRIRHESVYVPSKHAVVPEVWAEIPGAETVVEVPGHAIWVQHTNPEQAAKAAERMSNAKAAVGATKTITKAKTAAPKRKRADGDDIAAKKKAAVAKVAAAAAAAEESDEIDYE